MAFGAKIIFSELVVALALGVTAKVKAREDELKNNPLLYFAVICLRLERCLMCSSGLQTFAMVFACLFL